jgi:hypothetical protein
MNDMNQAMTTEIRSARPAVSSAALWASALLPALGLFLFGPLGILQANPEEFDSLPRTLLPVLLGAGLAVGALLALPGHAFPPAWRARWVSLLFVLGLLMWLQGAFLVHDYGVLDGRGMRFEGFGALASGDVLLWLAALTAAVIFAQRLASIAGFGATVFIVLQALPLTGFLLHFEVGPEEEGPQIPPDILVYSGTRNIVHGVFDNFQTDVFEQIVAEENLHDYFDGFTLYANNLAVAPHTSLAVPAIFSGRAYDGSMPADDYYQQAVGEGFHTRLHERGMSVNLLPLLSMRQGDYSAYFESPSFYGVPERQRLLNEAVQLIDVALFRQAPHLARAWVYNDNRWRLGQLLSFSGGGKGFHQRRFLADYIERIGTGGETPAYHYVHTWSPHPPFTTRRNGSQAPSALANTRENYLNEARPTVALMVKWIERLKALELYDEALIIFQSDHGGGYEPDFMPSRSLALLAVKPPGARGPLAISDAPSTVADVAATVLEAAGIEDPSFAGPSLFALNGADRLRRFVFQHAGEFHVIEVSGSSDNPAAYSPPRRLETVADSRSYTYGDAADVGLVGQGGRYLGEGWSAPEDRHVWSNGQQASLLLEVVPPASDLELILTFFPHVHAEALPEQRVEIFVNGRPLTSRVATEPGRTTFTMRIPRDWVSARQLEIRFGLPDAASPADLGTGGDRRELGIGLTSFRLQPVESSPAD